MRRALGAELRPGDDELTRGGRIVLENRWAGQTPVLVARPAGGRAEDLSGLPPAFIDVGTAALFLAEDVAFAQRIWAAGGRADLHVWAGGYHGFDALVPAAAISRAARAARIGWLRRILRIS